MNTAQSNSVTRATTSKVKFGYHESDKVTRSKANKTQRGSKPARVWCEPTES